MNFEWTWSQDRLTTIAVEIERRRVSIVFLTMEVRYRRFCFSTTSKFRRAIMVKEWQMPWSSCCRRLPWSSLMMPTVMSISSIFCFRYVPIHASCWIIVDEYGLGFSLSTSVLLCIFCVQYWMINLKRVQFRGYWTLLYPNVHLW